MENQKQTIQVNKKVKIELYYNAKNEPCAIGYWNTKVWFNYRYPNEERRNESVEYHKNAALASDLRKQEEKLQKKKSADDFKSKLKEGVILSDSWGWEQTNVDFYVVVSVKGSTVILQEVGHKQVGEPCSWASCHVEPDLENKVGEPIKKVVRGSSVKINSSVSLTLWDGRPMFKSWYA